MKNSVKKKGESSGIPNGRKSDGRFAAGNKISVGASPGRPVEKNRREYIELLREALTPEKWKQIIAVAFEDAVGDDAWARAKGREFFSKNVLPTKVEVEFTGETPVKIIAVEGFQGWKNNLSDFVDEQKSL